VKKRKEKARQSVSTLYRIPEDEGIMKGAKGSRGKTELVLPVSSCRCGCSSDVLLQRAPTIVRISASFFVLFACVLCACRVARDSLFQEKFGDVLERVPKSGQPVDDVPSSWAFRRL
jgi:hypothetical protein